MTFKPASFSKKGLAIFILPCVLTFYAVPLTARAFSTSELIDRMGDQLISISLTLFSLQKQIQELVYSLSSRQTFILQDYLKDLFESNGIFLNKDDFLEETQEPYTAFAKMLNLIPDEYLTEQKIFQGTANQISKQFLEVKGQLLLDGLYGKIDMHEHYRSGGNIEEFLKASGALGIGRTIFVATGMGPDNSGYKNYQKYLVKYVARLYPDKIIPFCTVDEADPDAATVFEECLEAGGRGLKLIGGHPSFYDVPLDSENMYRVYQKAVEHKVPVLLHASIINIPELKTQLDRIYADFPQVNFIHSHYCSTIFKGINLDQCAEFLEKFPNVYIDLSMGGGIKRYHGYFKEDLARVKDFILTYQDRILFGSDMILDKNLSKNFEFVYQRMRCDIDLHQQEQYVCPFGEKDWTHSGFNLSREVLKKLYFENPKKVLGF